MTKIRFAALLQLLLPVALLVGISAGAMTMAPEGEWMASEGVEQQIAAEVRASKPVNEWTTKDLKAAGWTGCVATATDPVTTFPVAHVVRTSVREGFRWVRMDAAEVAARIEAFGGTATTKDDPKVVGNCY